VPPPPMDNCPWRRLTCRAPRPRHAPCTIKVKLRGPKGTRALGDFQDDGEAILYERVGGDVCALLLGTCRVCVTDCFTGCLSHTDGPPFRIWDRQQAGDELVLRAPRSCRRLRRERVMSCGTKGICRYQLVGSLVSFVIAASLANLIRVATDRFHAKARFGGNPHRVERSRLRPGRIGSVISVRAVARSCACAWPLSGPTRTQNYSAETIRPKSAVRPSFAESSRIVLEKA
jgi:hypothetical protein